VGASAARFFRPTPKLTVDAISSASAGSTGATSVRVRSVRIAALPHAMSKPTPTTDTALS
jgi:hypothetical protein